MLDLKRRKPDVRAYVATLEEWIIRTLASFNVRGERREDRIGVWVRRPEKGDGREDKIAAIGIRLKKWVSLHGISLNVDPDLSHFSGIVPCGVSGQRYGVTSLVDLGLPVTLNDVDVALKNEFENLFGRTQDVATARRRRTDRLDRRQHREAIAAAQHQFVRAAFPLLDRIDARARRPLPAIVDHGAHVVRASREHRLDRSVAAVAHPSVQAASFRVVFSPGAIADALHAAPDRST